MKTKTAFTALGVLFDNYDLALISTNTKPIEIQVPESVVLRTGKIEIRKERILGVKYIEFDVIIDDFDFTDLCSYLPCFKISMSNKLEDFEPVEGINYGWHDLSEELQERIEEFCNDQWGHEYEVDEYFMTDLNED